MAKLYATEAAQRVIDEIAQVNRGAEPFGSLGLVIPSTAVLALESHGPVAGTASAHRA